MKIPPRLTLAFPLIAALCLSAAPALATWPHDANNGNLPLCTAAFNQANVAAVSDGAGGAILAWQDFRSGTNYDIYVQRVSAAGVPLWTANGVAISTAAIDQIGPMIVSDGAGGAIVAWQDFRSGTSYDVYAQRVNASGVTQWTANGVAISTTANDQTTPMIASDGAGGAIVTWQDFRSGTTYDVYAQRVSAAGAPQWTANGVAFCVAANSQYVPTIASDGAGGAIVTWQDFRSGTNYDIYAQRVNAAGATQWNADGVSISLAAGHQASPMIVADGTGGAIITWYDTRGGTSDIYAQRVTGLGNTAWAFNGLALCTAASDQYDPVLATDGSGGAIFAWYDYRNGSNYDVYAQRVTGAGAIQWTPDGIPVSTTANDQSSPAIVADGFGGAIITWYDSRGGAGTDIYAQRVSAAGSTLWTYNGVAISAAPYNQWAPRLVSDGAGGAVIAWYDFRSGVNSDIYAQRVELFGQLGNPEPTIASVRDIPNDQGGKIKVSWFASYVDVAPDYFVGSYWIWRSVPPNLAQGALARGAHLLRHDEVPLEGARGQFTTSVEGATTIFWEYVGSQVANGHPGYSYVVSTASDSVGGSNPRTLILVEAHPVYGPAFWDSAPDSGYSVDNLPPSAPSPFAGAYFAGATHLHWGANHEADLAGYRLYRGASSGFVPGPGNLVTAQPDTGFNDSGAAGSWYKLSAVDSHGNESLFAILGPGGTTDAPGPGAFALSFARPAPDPTVGGESTLRFTLPREGPATLVVMDTQGRLLRTLVSGRRPAGESVVQWDLTSDRGEAVPAGIYFLRLSAEGRTLTQRMVALR